MTRVLDPGDAQPGDVFFTAGSGWVDRLIRIVTTSRTSHCGIVVETDATGWVTNEALPDGGLASRYRRREDSWALGPDSTSRIHSIWRPPGDKTGLVVNESTKLVPAKYDMLSVWRIGIRQISVAFPLAWIMLFLGAYLAVMPFVHDLSEWITIPFAVLGWLIGLLGLRALFPVPTNTRPGYWFCSEHVTRSLDGAGVVIPGPLVSVSPGQLQDTFLTL